MSEISSTPSKEPGATPRLELVPCSLVAAKAFIYRNHSHNRPPKGWLFGTSVMVDGQVVGVGVAGRPVAHPLQDGRTIEVTRVCTLCTPNACSRLYGALNRAAKALGYRRSYTYTLASERATCVRAAGYVLNGEVDGDREWDSPARRRESTDLFGDPLTPHEAKRRWRRDL